MSRPPKSPSRPGRLDAAAGAGYTPAVTTLLRLVRLPFSVVTGRPFAAPATETAAAVWATLTAVAVRFAWHYPGTVPSGDEWRDVPVAHIVPDGSVPPNPSRGLSPGVVVQVALRFVAVGFGPAGFRRLPGDPAASPTGTRSRPAGTTDISPTGCSGCGRPG